MYKKNHSALEIDYLSLFDDILAYSHSSFRNVEDLVDKEIQDACDQTIIAQNLHHIHQPDASLFSKDYCASDHSMISYANGTPKD